MHHPELCLNQGTTIINSTSRVGSPGFSKTNIIRDMKDNLPLPQIPVYVTKDPYEYYGKFRYEIDISNLKKNTPISGLFLILVPIWEKIVAIGTRTQ